MPAPASFHLYRFMHLHEPNADTILGGSATPSLSLDEIVSLSSDPTTTSQAFRPLFTSQAVGLTTNRGSEALRTTIADTYDPSSKLTADHVLVANGTTGANHIIYRSLLAPGDHIVVQYPIYGPLIEEPRDIGCAISYLRLDPSKGWSLDLELLRSLIKPGKTKMIVLNNPGNPTGTQLNTKTQRSIIQLAKEHNIIIHCDEIFRPLFHTTEIPPSLNEHPDLDYDLIVTTSSLSKSYGLSGIRIGWITTHSRTLYEKLLNFRMFSVHALSKIDEAIATEALGPRVRPRILNKHLATARRNLDLIETFVNQHSDQCEWVRPTAGAVAFVKFKDHVTGKAVDDVDFCERLVKRKKVLFSPASLCFEFAEDGTVNEASGKRTEEFRGSVRFHFTTTTDVVERGLVRIGEFLDEERKKKEVVVNGAETVMPVRNLTS